MSQNNPYAPPQARVYMEPEPEIVAATRWERFRATLVDGLVLYVPPLGVLAVLIVVGNRDPLMFSIFGLVALIWLVVMAYFNIKNLVSDGQTVGKKIVGIRVINSQGENPGFWKIFLVRYLPLVVVSWALNLALQSRAPGGLVVLVDSLFIFGPTRRCLHDILADTHVVKA